MYEVLDKDTIKFEILPHLSVAKRGFVTKSDIYCSWDDSRYVLNYYDRIPLHVMHHFMEKEGIPVNLENLHRRCKINVRHKQLIELRGCIMANVTNNKRGPYV